ncbi:hypothetical protein CMUS01_04124 [Colletotrichum musicola]|uniref:Uncharacterized protein n=1 Tax=Colletotrichum musicola TaxID=2175873 RepID=A0A8H6U487_9PEZI|nr:hypothetical protein CMUS01_04124 [Colletotrichum musicola]
MCEVEDNDLKAKQVTDSNPHARSSTVRHLATALPDKVEARAPPPNPRWSRCRLGVPTDTSATTPPIPNRPGPKTLVCPHPKGVNLALVFGSEPRSQFRAQQVRTAKKSQPRSTCVNLTPPAVRMTIGCRAPSNRRFSGPPGGRLRLDGRCAEPFAPTVEGCMAVGCPDPILVAGHQLRPYWLSSMRQLDVERVPPRSGLEYVGFEPSVTLLADPRMNGFNCKAHASTEPPSSRGMAPPTDRPLLLSSMLANAGHPRWLQTTAGQFHARPN